MAAEMQCSARSPLEGDTPRETAENIDAVLAYMQAAEASMGSTIEGNDTIVSGRARILELVQHAVLRLGDQAEA